MHRTFNAVAAAVLLAAVGPSAAVAPATIDCGRVLGVSRTIEIDTHGGVLVGAQYVDTDKGLLADREVVLTFDDGPFGANTRSILDSLDRECAKATFFSVGRMALAYPGVLKEVAARGHTIGGHTLSHANLGRGGLGRAEAEIERGFSALAHALGAPVAPLFRFPYLSDPRAVRDYLGRRDVAVVGIDVDSFDTRTLSSARIADNIMQGLARHGRGVVLMHDLKVGTAKALPEILRRLRQGGYRLVHLRARSSVITQAASDASIVELTAKRAKPSIKTTPVARPRVEKVSAVIVRHRKKPDARALIKVKGRKARRLRKAEVPPDMVTRMVTK